MKKQLLLLIAILSFSISADAQWSFGIKGTFNRTWIGSDFKYFSPDNSAKSNGLGTSLQLYYQSGKRLAFGIEPGFVQRGSENPFYHTFIGFCGTGVDFTQFPYNSAAIYTDYIQLPLFVKYRVHAFNKQMELAGKIGQGVSFAMSGYQQAALIARGPEGVDTKPIEYGGDSEFRKMDIGTYAGISAGWHFPFGTVVAEYELYRGFVSIHEYFTGLKNQSAGYSLGYRIDF